MSAALPPKAIVAGVYSIPGLLHLVAAVFALLLGPGVLLVGRWGARAHKQLGYAYLSSMVLMLGTAFGVYRVYHGFGVFHYAALLTLLTLLAGMIPVFTKKPAPTWLAWHYCGMYWSIMELYVGLVAEVLSHQPNSFLTVASWSVTLVFLPGGVVFWWYLRQWRALLRRLRPLPA